MSIESQNRNKETVDPVDKTIADLLSRKWAVYEPKLHPTPTSEALDQEQLEGIANAIAMNSYVNEVPESWFSPGKLIRRELPNPSESRALVSEFDRYLRAGEIIGRLTEEVFKPFNEKVGSAVGAALNEALKILASFAIESRKDVTPDEYQAFVNYWSMLVALSAEFGLDVPVFGTLKHQGVPYPASINTGDSFRYTDSGARQNKYRVDIHDYMGANEMEINEDSIDGTIINGFMMHVVDLTIKSYPKVRADFSLQHRFDSSKKHNSQLITNHLRKTPQMLDDFSIRLDKDKMSPTGFSLDIGRDTRNNSELRRLGDVVGRILQIHRPEGCHFTEYFKGVSEADFDEFLSGLDRFLYADFEMSQLDSVLLSRELHNHPSHKSSVERRDAMDLAHEYPLAFYAGDH